MNVVVGNIITLGGEVMEYRSSDDYLYLTELGSPKSISLVSSGNAVDPLVIGQDTTYPPTEQYTSLDNGDVFAVPNNQSLVSMVNPTLDPSLYGLDFWESLSGELVTVKGARAISKPNQYGDTWVVGDWPTTGDNSRGGLTISSRDANPEGILIGDPLDGSSNPEDTKLGDSLEDITGVITYVYGFYTMLPLTAITVTASQSPALPPATELTSKGSCSGVTIGQYNVENLYSGSDNLDAIADHIANYLNSPDLMFVQEIQDNDGPTDDGVVDANSTLSALADAIGAAGGASYSFTDVDPTNDQDGGQPGGNIRNAYLYNPSVLRLKNVNPGSSTDATQVVSGPSLSFNPGLIDPSNSAWEDSRKPLAAQWETVDGQSTFFTVNVHFTSKGGSTSLQGDPRPPVNLGVDQRNQQANVTASFVAQILSYDPDAAVMVAGDFNEFQYVEPLSTTFPKVSGMKSLDDVVGISVEEQYTYLFGASSQELDHFFVSDFLTEQRSEYEHVHVNTWVTYDEQASDHDPSIARFNLC